MLKCFANKIGGCQGPMTGEHFISESVLLLVSDKDRKIHVKGLPWIPEGQKKHLSTGSFQSKILCKAHNEQLSPLDEEARKFFHFLRPGSPVQNEKVDGVLIEKWMIKSMIGMLASGNFKNDENKVEVDGEFLGYLFNKDVFAAPMGFMFDLEDENPTSRMEFSVDFQALNNPKEKSRGMVTSFRVDAFGIRIKFNFAEIVKEKLPKNIFGNNVSYRPSLVEKNINGSKARLDIAWPFPTDESVGFISSGKLPIVYNHRGKR